MTKILYIPTGEYVKLLSSVSYDISHPENITEGVIGYENSWFYRIIPLEEYIRELINGEHGFIKGVDRDTLILTEFEIIYD